MPDLVPVRVRDCAHPDAPPDGDFVYLYPKLSLEGGIEAAAELRQIPAKIKDGMAVDDAGSWLTSRWLVLFVKHGYAGGEVTIEELLADYDLGMIVAEAAIDLYSEAVLRPLGVKPPVTSPRGQTDGLTSPTSSSTSTPRRRSSRPATDGVPSAPSR